MSETMHGDELPRDFWDVSIALDRAYAPLRTARPSLSAARVRLALRRPEPVPSSVRVSRIAARFTEIALAAAVTAFAFVGSASVAPKSTIVEETATAATPTHVTQSFDDQNFIRWFRIGRYAGTADLVDASVSPSSVDDDNTPIARERTGLLR